MWALPASRSTIFSHYAHCPPAHSTAWDRNDEEEKGLKYKQVGHSVALGEGGSRRLLEVDVTMSPHGLHFHTEGSAEEKLVFTALRATRDRWFDLSGIYTLPPHSVLIFTSESTALRPDQPMLDTNSSGQTDSQPGWEQDIKGSN